MYKSKNKNVLGVKTFKEGRNKAESNAIDDLQPVKQYFPGYDKNGKMNGVKGMSGGGSKVGLKGQDAFN